MTAVRLLDSTKYGLKLFAYLVVVTTVGGGALALGGVLAWPEVQALRGAGQASSTELVAGGVLVGIGAVVLLTGYIGSAYKLVADAVATGSAASGAAASGSDASAADDAVEAEDVEATRAGGAAPDDDTGATGESSPGPTEQSGSTVVPGAVPTEATEESAAGTTSGATEPDSATAATGGPSTAGEEAAADDSGQTASRAGVAEPDPKPREPTAEEIAFGSASVDDGTEADGGDENGGQEGDPEPEVQESSGSVKPAARDAPSDPLGDRDGGS